MDDYSFKNEITQSQINIPRAALSFARSIAFPTLDIQKYLSRMDDIALAADIKISGSSSLTERVDALSDFLFFEMNFRGARGTGNGGPGDYSNPENSYLNRVIETHLGIPISLSVMYIAVAQRLGIPAYGIGLPGHFIVGIYDNGNQIFIDPFNAGLRLSVADCGRLVRDSSSSELAFNPKWLSPISPESLLARMLTNLCHSYIQREDWRSAIPVLQHLLMVQPDTDFHLRDLGYLYMYNGSLRLSAQYFENYLRRSPDASDFQDVRSVLQVVAGRLALWN